MKLSAAVDRYISDAQSSGRINSPSSERSYRSVLRFRDLLGEDPQ